MAAVAATPLLIEVAPAMARGRAERGRAETVEAPTRVAYDTTAGAWITMPRKTGKYAPSRWCEETGRPVLHEACKSMLVPLAATPPPAAGATLRLSVALPAPGATPPWRPLAPAKPTKPTAPTAPTTPPLVPTTPLPLPADGRVDVKLVSQHLRDTRRALVAARAPTAVLVAELLDGATGAVVATGVSAPFAVEGPPKSDVRLAACAHACAMHAAPIPLVTSGPPPGRGVRRPPSDAPRCKRARLDRGGGLSPGDQLVVGCALANAGWLDRKGVSLPPLVPQAGLLFADDGVGADGKKRKVADAAWPPIVGAMLSDVLHAAERLWVKSADDEWERPVRIDLHRELGALENSVLGPLFARVAGVGVPEPRVAELLFDAGVLHQLRLMRSCGALAHSILPLQRTHGMAWAARERTATARQRETELRRESGAVFSAAGPSTPLPRGAKLPDTAKAREKVAAARSKRAALCSASPEERHVAADAAADEWMDAARPDPSHSASTQRFLALPLSLVAAARTAEHCRGALGGSRPLITSDAQLLTPFVEGVRWVRAECDRRALQTHWGGAHHHEWGSGLGAADLPPGEEWHANARERVLARHAALAWTTTAQVLARMEHAAVHTCDLMKGAAADARLEAVLGAAEAVVHLPYGTKADKVERAARGAVRELRDEMQRKAEFFSRALDEADACEEVGEPCDPLLRRAAALVGEHGGHDARNDGLPDARAHINARLLAERADACGGMYDDVDDDRLEEALRADGRLPALCRCGERLTMCAVCRDGLDELMATGECAAPVGVPQRMAELTAEFGARIADADDLKVAGALLLPTNAAREADWPSGWETGVPPLGAAVHTPPHVLDVRELLRTARDMNGDAKRLTRDAVRARVLDRVVGGLGVPPAGAS